MALKKLTICIFLLFLLPITSLGSEGFFILGGNQKESYLKKSMPIGDALYNAFQMLSNLNAEIGGFVGNSQDLATNLDAFLAASDNYLAGSCEFYCQPNAAGPQDCSCRPADNASLLAALETEYNNLQIAGNNALENNQRYLNVIEKSYAPTKDILLFGNITNSQSKLIIPYKTFYQNYNQILRGKINTSLPVINPVGNVVIMEYIKRKLDIARLGFLGCNTPIVSENDIAALDSGTSEFKEPTRVDFIMKNYGALPDMPTSPLDYYCFTYQGIE